MTESLERGDATGWFDEVYARANGDVRGVPWAHLKPRAAFAEWIQRHKVRGDGRRALVVGCGLGDDAQELAARGFAVTAFDVAPTAIAWCKERFPASPVNYVVADMFNPPPDWIDAFDFVLEIFTVQALPITLRPDAATAVARFVGPSGALLVICMGVSACVERTGPPWPLTRAETHLFQHNGLAETNFEVFMGGNRAPVLRTAPTQWRIEYQRVSERKTEP
ncbi:MAG: class I SAM-dependent methyltransferase [Caldilineaceae bacterium]|nr:class I SAM-dependent methyltransferase [Caldilineaceae bacterium]